MIPTANTFQLEQILWQRHRLNFRPRGGNGLGCHTSFQPLFPRPLLSARVIVFLRCRKQIRARWQRDVSWAAISNTGLRLSTVCYKSELHRMLFVVFASRVYALAHCNEFEMVFHSLRVLLHAPRSSTYSISCGIPYTLHLHIYMVCSVRVLLNVYWDYDVPWSFNARLHYREPFVNSTLFAAARYHKRCASITFKLRGIKRAYSDSRCFICNLVKRCVIFMIKKSHWKMKSNSIRLILIKILHHDRYFCRSQFI